MLIPKQKQQRKGWGGGGGVWEGGGGGGRGEAHTQVSASLFSQPDIKCQGRGSVSIGT